MHELGGFLRSLDSQIYEILPGLVLWNREDRREGALSELEVGFCPWWVVVADHVYRSFVLLPLISVFLVETT